MLKEREFNDTIKGLTIFVDRKNKEGQYENIFIRDEGNVLSKVSGDNVTIFAKLGYVKDESKNLILLNGSIQSSESDTTAIVNFDKTELNFSDLSTKSISEPKLQETSTIQIIKCLTDQDKSMRNCGRHNDQISEVKIEINKRFGMPIFIPLIALKICFLLSSRKEKKNSGFYKYLYFLIAFIILITSEIAVRYSGNSLNYTLIYFLIPICLFPLIYLYFIKTYKYDNVNY